MLARTAFLFRSGTISRSSWGGDLLVTGATVVGRVARIESRDDGLYVSDGNRGSTESRGYEAQSSLRDIDSGSRRGGSDSH